LWLPQRKSPLTIAVNGYDDWALRGSKPRPHRFDTSDSQTQPTKETQLTPTPSDACTNNQETTKATDLDALAAELLALPKEERARHLAKLLGKSKSEVKAG
jgi:hypothetical protein